MSHFKGYPVTRRAKYKFIIYDETGLVAITGHLYDCTTDTAAKKVFYEELRSRIFLSGGLKEGYSFALFKLTRTSTMPLKYSWVKINPCGTRSNPRPRTTVDEYEIQGAYGSGWEMVTTEETLKAAREQLRCYNENEPYPHRIVKRRVKI